MPCQGEGRGFKSLFPLLKPQVTPGFFRVWERVCPLCATQLEWDLLLTSDIELATIDKGHWVPDTAKAFEKEDFSTISRGDFFRLAERPVLGSGVCCARRQPHRRPGAATGNL